MERNQFKTTINAPRERVWEILWGDETYPQWTSVFAEGSQVETDWKKGSRVLFLDGKGNGMVSVVNDNIPNEFMSFKHLGVWNNGKEDLETAQSKGWSGAMENYTLKTVNNNQTELTVDQDIEDDYKDQFLKMWPKALEKLKAMAEGNSEVGF
ncbi:MAG TPA: SRPBCC domain-containing protein, partial [Chryseolinea sp.]